MRWPLTFANHLLYQAQWAREKLSPFVGKHVRLSSALFSLDVLITKEGYLMSLPDKPPLKMDSQMHLVFSPRFSVEVQGDALVIEAMNFVARRLVWDWEEDLSRLVGDVAAVRLAEGGKKLVHWQQKTLHALWVRGISHQRIWADKQNMTAERRAIDQLADKLNLLGERIRRIETSHRG